MLFRKTILLAALLTGSALLTACDDQKPQADSTQTQSPAQNEPQSELKNKVNITNIGRTVTQRESGETSVNVVYSIQNLADKPLRSVTWVAAYVSNNQPIYYINVPFVFNPALAPQAAQSVATATLAGAIPEATRAIAINPNAQLETIVTPIRLEFEDGTVLSAK